MWYEELDVSGSPEVAEACTAQVAHKTDVRDEYAGQNDKNEWCGPSWNLVGSDTETD